MNTVLWWLCSNEHKSAGPCESVGIMDVAHNVHRLHYFVTVVQIQWSYLIIYRAPFHDGDFVQVATSLAYFSFVRQKLNSQWHFEWMWLLLHRTFEWLISFNRNDLSFLIVYTNQWVSGLLRNMLELTRVVLHHGWLSKTVLIQNAELCNIDYALCYRSIWLLHRLWKRGWFSVFLALLKATWSALFLV